MTDTPTDEKAVSIPRHAFVPLAALFLLLLAIIAVLAERGNLRPAAQAQSQSLSQTASVSATREAFSDVSLVGKAAFVIDLQTGNILYALHPDVQLPLASLTKIALALAVTEVLPAETVITIPRDTAPQGNPERLVKGDKWRVQDIVDFTLVASSNEGAEILANAADDSIRSTYPDAPENAATVWRMNVLAEQLGLTRTYFLNASGLDISPTLSGAYGSARDIAVLFGYAATQHLSLFSKTAGNGLSLTSVNGRSTVKAFNTNEVHADIPGLMMGKTGITDLAGGNLAVVFDAAGTGHPVVAVVLGSTREGRFSDIRQLVSRAKVAIAEQKKSLAAGPVGAYSGE